MNPPNQQSASLFGQPANSMFNLSATSQPKGQTNTLFGSPLANQPVFGQTGTSIFGQPVASQPQAQTSLFGSSKAPANQSIDQQSTQQSASLFGQPANPMFNLCATSQPQGQTNTLFGSPMANQTVVGQTGTSIFGQPVTPQPQAQTSLFGSSTAPANQQPAQPTQPQQQQQQQQQQTQQAQGQQQTQQQIPVQPQQQAQQQLPVQPQQQAQQQLPVQPQQPPQPPSMTFRQLEDNVNTWLSELNQLDQQFQQQAQAINSWDSLIVNNAVKIFQINQNVEFLKVENTRLDRQSDFIVEQQREIEKVLEPLEKMKLETGGNGERETTYSLVETVQNELHSLSEDLQNFIVKSNDVSSDENTSNPIHQIELVLNAQMAALQYVERHINSFSKAIMP